MSAGQMLKYHLLIPVGIFAVLVVVGVPLGAAFFVGMMSGCVGMMVMMMGGGRESHGARDNERDSETR